MRFAVWLVALAACDFTFNLDHIPTRDAASVDAAIDAGPFDLTTCPVEYSRELFAGSRYRILQFTNTAWGAHDDCIDDMPGATHLAVTQSREERDALQGALIIAGDGTWWLGGVQDASAMTVGEKWMWVTGEPFDENLWEQGTEPNDADGSETGHDDQFVDLNATNVGLADYAGGDPRPALCECDGRPMTLAAKVAYDQNRH